MPLCKDIALMINLSDKNGVASEINGNFFAETFRLLYSK